jgi:hypothetical protein
MTWKEAARIMLAEIKKTKKNSVRIAGFLDKM